MLSYSYSIGDHAHARDAVSRGELAAGMQLLRGLAMQTTRLQVAMLRREQRPAIESLDQLRDIDRELEHFIETIGPRDDASPELAMLSAMVARQKQALDTEKLALMSGVSGRLSGARAAVVEEDFAPEAAEPFSDEAEIAEAPRRATGVWLAIGLLAIIAALGAGGWYYSDLLMAYAGL